MKKNTIVLFFLVFSTITSILLLINCFWPIAGLEYITRTDRLAVWAITAILFIYYRSLNPKPQLAPSMLAVEKDNGKAKDKPDVSFKDVAGLEEIKEELQETIDFMINPEKYRRMGAKIPKGILFYGPPGTGKTLLAKAVAGETNSTFLYASGSEFVEKYVGVGAKRVRTLFEKGKKEAPAIIFIDEIDAIGSRRNQDSNNEKDQTLNQLLVELDGFNTDDTVIVIGATNRIDLLDEALLRPGRFDRHIYVGNPNLPAREQILTVHTKNKPLDETIDIKALAKKTTGLSGAQLANIANEAAIIAVRKNKKHISIEEFEAAIERVIAGLELKNPNILEKERKVVAFHEAGHALVAKLLDTEIVQKISIIPRGQALGYVLKFPDEDRYLLSQKELEDKITTLLAGRAAEQVIFKEITTGAKDDLKKATSIAREMVCSYGMSPLGTLALDEYYIKYNYDTIRLEIKKITDRNYDRALELIQDNLQILHTIAERLLEKETIDSQELDLIFKKYQRTTNYAM